jgi:hypothetical protein
MPFIDKTPLNYKPNTASTIRRFLDDRAPTSADYRNFKLGDEWLDTSSNDWWKLCDKTTTAGTWRKMAGTASAIETVTGDAGGAVPPDGVNNLNLIGGVGITVTGTPATNTLSIDGSGVDQQQIIYVGKHGNDANDGLTIEAAKLTFTNAIATASGISPASVVCLDAGTYTENITMPANVFLDASSATLSGTILVVDNTQIALRSQLVPTGLIGISKTAGTGYARISIDIVTCSGSGIGVVCTSGSINMKCQSMFVDTGFGIGSTTSSHIHLEFEDIYLTGAGGTALALAAGSTVYCEIQHISNIGAGTGNGVLVLGGELNLYCHDMNVVDALNVDVGTLNYHGNALTGSGFAYDVAAGAELNIFINENCSSRWNP